MKKNTLPQHKTNLATEQDDLNRRYRLERSLGMGSMGHVYQATDRLTRKTIAIKRIAGEFRIDDTPGNTSDISTALAHEFRTLTSLHHPNIIQVFDFGFDTNQYPYYTMEYLSGSVNILEAVSGEPLAVKVELLAQALSAITYLHNNAILHRDIKPENLQVIHNKHLKVLDFGLSALRISTKERVGTLRYMAPEVLSTGHASPSSDLYSLGVVAYQIFLGQHPFQTAAPSELVSMILNSPPDFSDCPSVEITQLLERWLNKDPDLRYQQASELLIDLYKVIEAEPSAEKIHTLESHSQAPLFIGREQELTRMRAAYSNSAAGHGEGWFICGESGVGKSRLLDEFHLHTLLNGAWVMRGQAIQEGSTPFTLWRDPLRHLVLSTDLTEQETDLLQVIIPDLEELLQQPLKETQEYSPKLFQVLLFNLVMKMLKSQQEPLVIILEDLQWAGSESMALLQRILPRLQELPVLIVATCRDREAGMMREAVNNAHFISLNRLSEQDITSLSISVLGEIGKRPDIINYLYTQTDGNPFFLIELLNTLSRQAEQLYKITDISRSSFAKQNGLVLAKSSKIDSLPENYRHLLLLAAVAGRYLDRQILSILSEINLESWMLTCANAAIIEFQDDQWRFTHDRLRESLLHGLTAEEQKRYYRKVAEAIEQAYPDDPEQSSHLAYLWGVARQPQFGIKYALIAGNQFRQVYANEEAIHAFQQVVNWIDNAADLQEKNHGQLFQALGELGKVYYDTGQLEKGEAVLRRAIELGKETNTDQRELIILFHWLGETLFWTGDLEGRLQLGLEGLALLGENTATQEAAILNQLIAISYRYGLENMERWQEYTLRTAAILPNIPYTPELRPAFIHVYMVHRENRRLEIGLAWLEQFEAKAEEIHDAVAVTESKMFQGHSNFYRGDFESAEKFYAQVFEMGFAIGDTKRQFWSAHENSWIDMHVHRDLDAALSHAETALQIAKEHRFQEDNYGELCADLGLVYFMREEHHKAFQFWQEAYDFSLDHGYRVPGLWAAYLIAWFHLANQDHAAALPWLEKATAQISPKDLEGQTALNCLKIFGAYESALLGHHADESIVHSLMRKKAENLPESFTAAGQPATPLKTSNDPANTVVLQSKPLEGWQWVDPFADCSSIWQHGLTIKAKGGRNLWHSNLSAPRWMREANGSFVIQTVCFPANRTQPAVGGLLIWQDRNNFLWLMRDYTGPGEVCFAGCIDNRSVILGRARLGTVSNPESGVCLRLERNGSQVRALAYNENNTWYTAGETTFPNHGSVKVGLFAAGDIPKNIYPHAPKEGTAVRFQIFWHIPIDE
jgi:serine/threonine protein kinase/tetratricopeptide (TPR) repeat protein